MILKEFKERYRKHEFDDCEYNTQIRAGWEDWFCDFSELPRRLAEIWKVLEPIKKNTVLNAYSVQFYNRCPIGAPLYDEVLFVDAKGYNKFNIEIDSPRGNGKKYAVCTSRRCWNAEASFDDIKDVVNWILQFETNNPFRQGL